MNRKSFFRTIIGLAAAPAIAKEMKENDSSCYFDSERINKQLNLLEQTPGLHRTASNFSVFRIDAFEKCEYKNGKRINP